MNTTLVPKVAEVRTILLVTLSYALAMIATLQFIVAEAGVAVFWPPAGVLLAGMLLAGRSSRHWILALAFLADIACNRWAPVEVRPWGVSVGFAASDIAGVWIACLAIARLWKNGRTLDDRARVSALVVASLVAGATAATLATGVSWVTNRGIGGDPIELLSDWGSWLSSTIGGVLVFAPLVFALGEVLTKGTTLRPLRPRAESLGLLAFSALLALALFSQPPELADGLGPALYLLFPALVWAAIRCDRLTVSLMIVAATLIAFALTVSGLGPVATADPAEPTRWTWLQVWTIALTITSLYLSAANAQLAVTRAALSESESRNRALIDAMPAALLVHDGASFLYLNPVAREMLGVSGLDGLRGRSPLDVLSPDSRKSVAIRPSDVAPGSVHPPLVHQRWLRPDGSRVDARVASVACTFGGRPAVQVVAIDATELERAAALLKESRLQLHSILGSLEDAVLSLSADGSKVLYANDAAEKLLGVPFEELVRAPARRLDQVSEDDAPALRSDLARIRERGSVDREYRVRSRGGVRWVHERSQIVRDEHGIPIRIDSVISDVTDRKASFERRLREQRLFDAGPCVAWRWRSADGWPVEFVSSNVSQFGYVPEDFMTGRVAYGSVIHPDDLARVAGEVRQHVEAGRERFEQRYRFRRRDGAYREVQDFTSIVRDSSGAATHFEGYILDITDAAASERERAELSERFRQFATNIDSILWMVDPASNRTLFVNAAYERVFGRSAELLVSEKAPWLEGVHPEDVASTMEAFRDWLADGSRVSPEFEYRVVRPDGTVRWIRDRAFRLSEAGTDAGRVIGIAHDVTDERESEAERERLLSELAQARRTEAVGSFASKIAHDLKNLMMPIITYTELSASDLGPDHPVAKYLANISQAAATASELTKRLLVLRDRPATVRLAPEPFQTLTRQDHSASAPQSPLRILVVEDEDLVRGLLHRSLEQAGHRVHAVRTPEEGLRIAEELRDLDVLVADVSLPGMDGRSLHSRIVKVCPLVSTVLVSGAPLDPSEPLPDRTLFLPKPFSMADLTRAIDRLSEGGPGGLPSRAPA